MQAAAGFPVAAPDTLVGLPRQDVRLVGPADSRAALVVYGQGLGAIVLVERANDGKAAAPGPLASLPKVSLERHHRPRARDAARDGADLGSRRRHLHPRGVTAEQRRRGGRCGDRVSNAEPIEARGLVKRYGEIVAVDHVDLTVERGDVFGYLGPERRGEDDVAAHAARTDPADRGTRSPLRA